MSKQRQAPQCGLIDGETNASDSQYLYDEFYSLSRHARYYGAILKVVPMLSQSRMLTHKFDLATPGHPKAPQM